MLLRSPSVILALAVICVGSGCSGSCVRATSVGAATLRNKSSAIAQTDASQVQSGRPGAATIIVDLSKSFSPIDKEKEAALRGVAEAVVQLLTHSWPSGSLYVSAIGKSSLTLDAPCGSAITYEPRLIQSDTNDRSKTKITRPDLLKSWVSECLGLIKRRSAREEPFTDISGAVAMAARSMKDVSGQKLLCIMSDFVEDLPRGNLRAEFSLSGERVLMLWAPQSRDPKDPNQLFKRLADWEERFKRAGASEVVQVPIAGFTNEQVTKWTR
jgi:hypothetical protein